MAFDWIEQRIDAINNTFFVYEDGSSAFNHGELGLFGSPNTSLISVDGNARFDPSQPDGIATDPAVMLNERGFVLRVDVQPLSSGQFAGLLIRGTSNVPTGYDLSDATQLVFEAASPMGQVVNIDVGGASVAVQIPSGNVFQTFSIPLSELEGENVNFEQKDNLFAVGITDINGATGAHFFLDNVRYEPTPISHRQEIGLPLSNETFAVVPELRETTANQHPVYPLDQVVKNVATVYESSMTAINLFDHGRPDDLEGGRLIADAFVYALNHDLINADGSPNAAEIAPVTVNTPNGSVTGRGLHDAYQAGPIARGPGAAHDGQVRLAGFSVGAHQEKFYLVQDGANGGNNAFAIMALLKAFDAFGDMKYLNTARQIAGWIAGALKDTTPVSPTNFGGYFFGYNEGGAPEMGTSPRVINRAKSIENNADIYAALSQLATVEQEQHNTANALFWTEHANHAGDMVMRLYDAASGRFHSGTVPDATTENATDEKLATGDFMDAQTFVTLALAGSARYRQWRFENGEIMDWHRPVRYALTAYDQVVTANGLQFQGFSLTPDPTPTPPAPASPRGIAWEFTGQLVNTMQFVDALYAGSEFATEIALYSNEIRRAQELAPFGNGLGLVAATLHGEDDVDRPYSPLNQALTTPFQRIPERVGLAATNWAIFASQGNNLFMPQRTLPSKVGEVFLVDNFDFDVTRDDLGSNLLGGNVGELNQPEPSTPAEAFSTLTISTDSHGTVGGSLQVDIDFTKQSGNAEAKFAGTFMSLIGLTDTKQVTLPGQLEPANSTAFPGFALDFDDFFGATESVVDQTIEQIAFDTRLVAGSSPVTVKIELKDESGFDVFTRVDINSTDWGQSRVLPRSSFNRSVSGGGTNTSAFDWNAVSLMSFVVEKQNVADNIDNPSMAHFQIDNVRLIDVDGIYPDVAAAADPATNELNFAYEHAVLDHVRDLSAQYFVDFASQGANTGGVIQDRSTFADLLTVGGIGFQLNSYISSAEQGLLTRGDAAERTLNVLRLLANGEQGPDVFGTIGYQGFFYHFLGSDGNRKQNFDFTSTPVDERLNTVELSTIDTALAVAGAITSGEYFVGNNAVETEIRELAHEIYANVNWPFMLYRNANNPADPSNQQMYLGWKPTENRNGPSFEINDDQGLGQYSGIAGDPATVDYYTDEGLLIALLAMGSPTAEYRLDPNVWYSMIRADENGSFVKTFPGSLFTYQFFSTWVDTERLGTDNHPTRPTDWFENTQEAIRATIDYVAANPEARATFANSQYWGLSATEGPYDDYFAEAAPDAAIHRDENNDQVLDEPRGIVVPSGPEFNLQAEAGSGAGLPMTRSEANGAISILLLSDQTRTLRFTLDGTARYVPTIRYSNDNFGATETISLSIDGNLIGSFLAEDTGDNGNGWNVFVTSAGIGNAPILLNPGSHTVTVTVTGGDGFGTEIDAVYLTPQPAERPLELGTATSYGVGSSMRHLPVETLRALWALMQADLNQDQSPDLLHPRVGFADAFNLNIADALLTGVDHLDEARILRTEGAWATFTQYAIDAGPMLAAIDNYLTSNFIPSLFMTNPDIRSALQRVFPESQNGFTEAPIITSPSSVSVLENTQHVLTIEATDGDQPVQQIQLTISGGADQDRFTLSDTGVLTFIAPPNFEAPTDANSNNTYEVEIQATDEAGGGTTQQLAVSVLNELLPARIVPLPDSPNAVRITRQADRLLVINGTSELLNVPIDDIAGVIIEGGADVDSVVVEGSISHSFLGALVIEGGAGNDVLDASGIQSTLNVVLTGQAGDDKILGGAGDDVLRGGAGRDHLIGNAGDDQLFGQGSVDTLEGGAGVDLLDGGDSASAISDEFAGDLTLTNSGYETVRGDRAIAASITLATLIGSAGPDNVNTNAYSAGLVTVHGGDGNDTMAGGPTNEFFYGDGGDDFVRAAAGRDFVSGGAGNDTVRGQGGVDTLSGGLGNDRIDAGLEDNQLQETTDDNLTVRSNAGVVTLTGLGTDIVQGTISSLILTGGDGPNELDVTGFAGIATLIGGAGNDELRGSANNDYLVGGSGNDTLIGNAGHDLLSGEAGLDQLFGGTGDDRLRGGSDNDQLDGGIGDDQALEQANANFVVVGFQLTTSVTGTDLCVGIEVLNLTGGSGANVLDARQSSLRVFLNGSSGNDTLLGSVFPDTLLGGSGNDILLGGAGNDSINGETGSDTFYEIANANFTVIGTRVTSTAIGSDTVSAIESIAIVGGVSANVLNATAATVPVTLLGAAGNDTLIGGSQSDVLIGGHRANTAAGTDSLNGLGGADRFDNDPADTRLTDGLDQVVANLFASLPSWLDQI